MLRFMLTIKLYKNGGVGKARSQVYTYHVKHAINECCAPGNRYNFSLYSYILLSWHVGQTVPENGATEAKTVL